MGYPLSSAGDKRQLFDGVPAEAPPARAPCTEGFFVADRRGTELHRGAVGYHVTMSTLKAWIERKRWHKEPRSQGRLRAPDAPPVHEEPPARPLQAFLPPSSR